MSNGHQSDYQYWNTSNNGAESPMIPTYEQQMQAKYANEMHQASNVNMQPNADIPNASMQQNPNVIQSIPTVADMMKNGTFQEIADILKRKGEVSSQKKSTTIKEINIKITIEVTND